MGAFSTVELGIHWETGQEFAIKIIRKAKLLFSGGVEPSMKYIRKEVEILSTVRHANVISLVEAVETPDALYLVMPKVSGGELFNVVFGQEWVIDEAEAKFYFYQMVDAVHYLHTDLKVAHRDLKPENILMEEHK